MPDSAASHSAKTIDDIEEACEQVSDAALAENAAYDVQVDASLEAFHDGEVNLWQVRCDLLGLHDAPGRLLHRRIRLLRRKTATEVVSAAS
jgi:hypothetical protein